MKQRNRQSSKWLGITKPKWREIAGFVVLIPWIYNDLIDSHNFVKLIFLAVSLAIAQGVVLSFLKSRPKALILWFVSLVPLACVVWANSRPLPVYVSLEAGPIIDPKSPWGTSFVICNQGSQPIYRVGTAFYWSNPNEPFQVFQHIISNPIDEIPPNFKTSVHLEKEPEFPISSPAWVNVTITYTQTKSSTKTNEDSENFQFCVRKDQSGNYIWLPAGEGKTLNELASNNMPAGPIPLNQMAPLIGVEVNDFEDFSRSNKDYPIRIMYSWKNIGSEPATGIYIEWRVVDKQFATRMVWKNPWPESFFNQVLWLGMTNSTAQLYTDTPDHEIFNGIMSGKFALFGLIYFRDLEDHKYAMQIMAIHEGNKFEIEGVALGGYFEELMETNPAVSH